ncbi:MAG: c-type cytochrome [Saprospiraceae bacterium]|nr:c-type cytochrome [Saprospiraceae bacterium]
MKPILLLTILLLTACNGLKPLEDPEPESFWHFRLLPENPQDWNGDPEAGLNYLVTGNYIGSGVPVALFADKLGEYQDTLLRREGLAAYVDHTANIFPAANGTEVITGNCFSCHAYTVNDEVFLGLGNPEDDYQKGLGFKAWLLNVTVKAKYKKDSPEREAFGHFGDYYKAISPNIKTNNPVVNPAFRLEEACAMYRNPIDLTYTDKPQFETISYTLAADVPPLWNVRKKSGLYYNGMGRGDFTKLLMQASVLGIADSTAAREAQAQFDDVLAWVAQLEPPEYPYPIDYTLAEKGEILFNDECAKCHGTYGEFPTYPNKLVSTKFIGTDPFYARYFTRVSGLADWYNASWFAQSEPRSSLEPLEGYIAPPLDGVWATAPYFHNGSVPTIASVINSDDRPDHWTKVDGYDQDALGWKISLQKSGRQVYKTDKPGYSNQGHYFGDPLSDMERQAILEYLKTL